MLISIIYATTNSKLLPVLPLLAFQTSCPHLKGIVRKLILDSFSDCPPSLIITVKIFQLPETCRRPETCKARCSGSDWAAGPGPWKVFQWTNFDLNYIDDSVLVDKCKDCEDLTGEGNGLDAGYFRLGFLGGRVDINTCLSLVDGCMWN